MYIRRIAIFFLIEIQNANLSHHFDYRKGHALVPVIRKRPWPLQDAL